MANFIRYLKNNKEEKPINIGLTTDYARTPYAGLYPKDYQMPEKLFAFRQELDLHIKDLFDKDAVDAGNDKALDDFITNSISSYKEEINTQRADHHRIIFSLISRWNGDLIDGQLKIEEYQKELDTIEMELAEINSSTTAINAEKTRGSSDKPADDNKKEVIIDAS